MIQESDLILLNNLGHVLKVHNEQNQEDRDHQESNLDHGESSRNNIISLLAAFEIETSIILLLILHKNILVVFPNSCNFNLFTSELLDSVSKAWVLSCAALVHECLLTKLGEDEWTFTISLGLGAVCSHYCITKTFWWNWGDGKHNEAANQSK